MFYSSVFGRYQMFSGVFSINVPLCKFHPKHLWCDLRKPVTWCKFNILRYWNHVKVWIILFPELFTWISTDTGIKSYWSSKAIKNERKTLEFFCEFPLFCSFTFCDMWRVFTDDIAFIRQNMSVWFELRMGLFCSS